MSERLRVNIFKDIDAESPIDSSLVPQGLSLVDPRSEFFDVTPEVFDHALMPRTPKRPPLLMFDGSTVPVDDAYFNIVLTDKNLAWNDTLSKPFTGIAHNIDPLTGYAVLNATTHHAAGTVAHEIGHLLGMRYEPDIFNATDHCTKLDCIMHGEKIPSTEYAQSYRHPRPRQEKFLNENFCTPCQKQLAERALVLIDISL